MPCDDRSVTTGVLIVDDDAIFRELAQRVLAAAGVRVIGEAASATSALAAATIPYVLQLANGVDAALVSNHALARGLMTRDGKLTNQAVAAALGL